jgi:hypothetical protein
MNKFKRPAETKNMNINQKNIREMRSFLSSNTYIRTADTMPATININPIHMIILKSITN